MARRATDWAVHVALAIDGAPVLGAVALPDAGLVLRIRRARRAARPANDPPRMVVSRTRPAAEAVAVAEAHRRRAGPDGLGRRQGDGGGARRGRHLPALGRPVRMGQLRARSRSRWPRACIARGIDGTPLVYNRADIYIPDLLICRKELVGAVTDALAVSTVGNG